MLWLPRPVAKKGQALLLAAGPQIMFKNAKVELVQILHQHLIQKARQSKGYSNAQRWRNYYQP
jgi:hypothetical protein